MAPSKWTIAFGKLELLGEIPKILGKNASKGRDRTDYIWLEKENAVKKNTVFQFEF